MFSIIGKDDVVIFTAPLRQNKDIVHLHQFIMHSSLDKVEHSMFKTNDYFLKDLEEDKSSEYSIFCFITSKNTKFLLLIERRDEKKVDKVKMFFGAIHKLYAKQLMNPLYEINSKIENPLFKKIVYGYIGDYLSIRQ